MTNTVQRLQALGYVMVIPDPQDGRGKLVRITEAGETAHREAIGALGPDLAAIEAELGAEAFVAASLFWSGCGPIWTRIEGNRAPGRAPVPTDRWSEEGSPMSGDRTGGSAAAPSVS